MAKEKTLLEKAVNIIPAVATKVEFSDEEMELALAWAHSKITLNQIRRVLDRPHADSRLYVWLARALRQHFTNGNG